MLKRAGLWLWRKKWWLVGLVVLLGIGGLIYYRQSLAKQPSYTYTQPEMRTIIKYLETSGILEADEKAQLRFPASSRLTWIGVAVGETVTKWQAIAKVDTQTLQKQMAINQNLHAKEFRDFEGSVDTYDYYSPSGLTEAERRVMESAQLDLRNTALTVEINDIAIKLSSLYSPIKGVVTRLDQTNVGALVLPTDVFEVVDPETLHFASVIDEQDIAQVKVGQAAKVILDAFVETTIAATVSSIAFSPSPAETGGTGYKVKFPMVQENNLAFRLGMNGEGKIVLDQKYVIAIPIDSTFEREGKTYTRIKQGETVAEREIETGIDDGDWIEAINGLTLADTIAVPSNGQD